MSSSSAQKVLCVLYPDPVTGFPPNYAREGIPSLTHYPDGQTLPSPASIDFNPGHLLGSVSGGLGLQQFLAERGHRFVVTSDKDGPDSVFERELTDADVIISQPFWPGYLTAERIEKASNLRIAITAGIGSDHVDLQAAIDRNITVCEVTWCNSISVAEHAVMQMLALVRDFIPQYGWVVRSGWNIADAVSRSYDIEGMDVGVVAAGRIGLAVLKRMKPFDVNLHYTDRHRLTPDVEQELGLTFHETVESLVSVCDVVSIHCPLHPETENMFNDCSYQQDEARVIHRKHRQRQDLRPGCHRKGPGKRPAGRLCGRRLVPSAGPQRPSLEVDAQPRHDTPHLGHIPFSPGPLRSGSPRDSGVLDGWSAYPGGVPDSAGRRPCRRWSPLLQRGRCYRRLGGSDKVHGARSLSEKQYSKRYASLVECKDVNNSTTKSRLL